MTDIAPSGWGTLVVDCEGAPLPVEVIPRGPVKAEGPAPSLQGVTGQPLALPPGEYLVKTTLPPSTSQGQSSVTVPVLVGIGEWIVKDLSDAIVERLTSIDLKTTLPVIGAPVSIRPALRDASQARALDVELMLPVGVTIKHTVDEDMLRSWLGTAGRVAADASVVIGQMLSAAWSSQSPPVAGMPAADTPESATPEASASGGSATGPDLRYVSIPAVDRFERAAGWLMADWNGRAVLAVIPVDRTGSTTASLSPPPGEVPRFTPPQLELSFSDPELHTRWRFLRAGALQESRQLAGNVPGSPKWLDGELELLRRSPLTAVLDAYVLLRANWRQDLCDFTTLALKENPDLSDIRVIHAEVLGRMGHHRAAADVLIGLGHGPCPWPVCRLGMSYALARTQLYLELGEQVPEIDKMLGTLLRLEGRLSSICAAADPNQIPIVLSGTRGLQDLQTLLTNLEA